MRVLIFNQTWFADELRSAGHDVMVVGFGRDFPTRFDYSALHIDTILKKLPRDFEPDAILLHDESSPWFVAGLDETPIPVMFYSVDTHHHYALHRYLAHTADTTFIAQSDYAEHFSSIGDTPQWLPLWASRPVEPSEERIASVCFVGNLNRDLNPSRVDFFEALQKKVEVLIAHGAFWEYFPKSEIVINQTVKGDLNFRVFEALMCGTVLLTEASGNGLFDLFQDGEHLVSYRKGDVDHAVERIREILSDKARARRIARQGRDEVLAKHLPVHRAQTIDAALRSLSRQPKLLRHTGAFVNFSALGASAFEVDRRLSSQALVHALKAGQRALECREPMTVELACHAIRSAYLYDLIFSSRAGEEFVRDCSEAHPELPVLALARVRALLNRGDHREAQAWVKDHFGVDEKKVFDTAEQVVTQILSTSVAPHA